MMPDFSARNLFPSAIRVGLFYPFEKKSAAKTKTKQTHINQVVVMHILEIIGPDRRTNKYFIGCIQIGYQNSTKVLLSEHFYRVN